MPRVGKQAAQLGLDVPTFAVARKGVVHAVQRLNDSHGRPVRPIETAGCRMPEVDLLVAEFDGFQSRIDQDHDACWHRGGETEFVGGSHAVDEGTDLGRGG